MNFTLGQSSEQSQDYERELIVSAIIPDKRNVSFFQVPYALT